MERSYVACYKAIVNVVRKQKERSTRPILVRAFIAHTSIIRIKPNPRLCFSLADLELVHGSSNLSRQSLGILVLSCAAQTHIRKASALYGYRPHDDRTIRIETRRSLTGRYALTLSDSCPLVWLSSRTGLRSPKPIIRRTASTMLVVKIGGLMLWG